MQAHLDWTASAPVWSSVRPRSWALWAAGGLGKTGYLAVRELERSEGYGTVALLSGLVSFSVLAFLAARSSGRGFWWSLGKGLGELFKALGHLLP